MNGSFDPPSSTAEETPEAARGFAYDRERQEHLPRGTLRVRFAHGRALREAAAYLASAGVGHTSAGGLLIIRTGDVLRLAEELASILPASEQAGTHLAFGPEETTGETATHFGPCTLGQLLDAARGAWVSRIMREGGLYPVFQPIVCCDRPGVVMGYEILARGLENGAVIYPLPMLEAARGCGLMWQFERLAGRAALHGAARFRLPTKIFINVTPVALRYAWTDAAAVVRRLNRLRINPRQVVLEVLEGEQIDDASRLRASLAAVRACGVEIALDDFGAAYSSLKLLSELRPDYIKIDMSLIRGVDRNPYRAALLRPLFEATREVGVKTIAEGVETEGEYRWVREHGAHYAQGYRISRPSVLPPFMSAAAC